MAILKVAQEIFLLFSEQDIVLGEKLTVHLSAFRFILFILVCWFLKGLFP